MDKFVDKHLTTDKQLAFLWFGSFVAVFIGVKLGFVEANIALGLLAFTGVVLAFRKYVYEKQKDSNSQTIELISFFRDECLKKHSEFANLVVGELGRKHQFVKVNLKTPTIEYLRSSQSSLARKQSQYLSTNKKIENAAVNVLNAVEEFSLKVVLLESTNSKYLSIVHVSLVQIVEDLGTLLLAQRELINGETMYVNTLNLYSKWEPIVDKKTPEERRDLLYKKLRIVEN